MNLMLHVYFFSFWFYKFGSLNITLTLHNFCGSLNLKVVILNKLSPTANFTIFEEFLGRCKPEVTL